MHCCNFANLGEKPFRCLFPTCLKRFRYKGDLSKHIKRYHPGHNQVLVPLPLQEDELVTLQKSGLVRKNTTATPSATVTSNSTTTAPSQPSKASSVGTGTPTLSTAAPPMVLDTSAMTPAAPNAGLSTLGTPTNKFFCPLLPQHPVKQSELINAGLTTSVNVKVENDESMSDNANLSSDSSFLLEDNDPSLDDNILNMLTEEPGQPLTPTSKSGPSGIATPTLNLSGVVNMVPSPTTSVTTSNSILHSALTRVTSAPASTTAVAQAPVAAFVVPSLKTAAIHVKPRQQSHILTTSNGIRFSLPTVPTTVQSTARPKFQPKIIGTVRAQSQSSPNTPVSVGAACNSSQATKQPVSMTIKQVLANVKPVPRDEVNLAVETQGNLNKPRPNFKILTIPASAGPPKTTAASSTVPTHSPLVNAPNIIRHASSSSSATNAALGPSTSGTRPAASATLSTAPTVSQQEFAATALLPARPKKPFACTYQGCNRSFEKANLLKRHMKLHSGDCKFVCDRCQKCFESQSKLDDHYRKHTGEKPFVCEVCGNHFRYKGSCELKMTN